LFAVGLLVLDRAAGFAIGALAEQTMTGETTGGLVRQALAHRDSDIIVFGTSRARRHIDPVILEQELSATAWNAACDAQSIPYALVLETLLLEQDTSAKLLVITAEPTDFLAPNTRAHVLAPWVGKSDAVDEELYALTTFEPLKLLSVSYRYNSRLLALLKQRFSPTDIGNKGYLAMEGELPAELQQPLKDEGLSLSDLPNREAAERQHRKFMSLARERGIEVYVTISPRFVAPGSDEPETRELILSELERIADEEGAKMSRIDEVTHPELNAPEMFRDPDHLNGEGARRFSRLLAAELARAYPELFSSRR